MMIRLLGILMTLKNLSSGSCQVNEPDRIIPHTPYHIDPVGCRGDRISTGLVRESEGLDKRVLKIGLRCQRQVADAVRQSGGLPAGGP